MPQLGMLFTSKGQEWFHYKKESVIKSTVTFQASMLRWQKEVLLWFLSTGTRTQLTLLLSRHPIGEGCRWASNKEQSPAIMAPPEGGARYLITASHWDPHKGLQLKPDLPVCVCVSSQLGGIKLFFFSLFGIPMSYLLLCTFMPSEWELAKARVHCATRILGLNRYWMEWRSLSWTFIGKSLFSFFFFFHRGVLATTAWMRC